MCPAAFSCPQCGFSDPARQVVPGSEETCPQCGAPALRERVEQLIRRHQSANERAGRVREEQDDLQQRLTVIAEQLGVQGRSQKDHFDHLAELTRAREEEHQCRQEAEAKLEEALARLDALRERTAPSLDRLQRDNEDLARSGDQARLAIARLEKELQEFRSQDRAAAPIDQTLSYLEEENAALRKKLELAQETIIHAARLLGGIDALRTEVDRLGTLYLQAREDARAFQADKQSLESELSQIVDRFLAQSPVPLPPPSSELEEARKRIREAGARLGKPGESDSH
jgi:chromosome segregation ATPase